MEPDFGPSDPAHAARLREQVRALRDENERLSRLTRIRERSINLQATREMSLIERAARDEATLRELYASTFWQVTAPLRFAARLIGGGMARRALAFAAEAGWRAAARRSLVVLRAGARRTLRQLSARLRRPAGVVMPATVTPAQPVTTDAAAILGPHVLIIAELSVPQCSKYRVWQKREMLDALGIGCTVADWHDLPSARSALQVCSLVIFYRVPGTPGVLHLIAEAERLGVAHWWEVDDLVFDEALYIANGNVDGLDPEARDALLNGVRLYRRAMLACDRGIASTARLAALMREAGVGETCVIENALDADTLEIAASLRERRSPSDDGTVRITYGSGSRTHDIDFASAAPALLRLMRERPGVRLRIVGELTLPAAMDEVAARVERLGQTDYPAWLALLAVSDVSLAPLAPTAFNDAKSNIKYLEAAILGVPSICSPRASFRSAIEDGVTATLAEGEEAWYAGLARLIDDAPFRRRMGEAALRSVLARYAPPALARAQVAPFVATAGARAEGRLRVIVVSALFPPRIVDEAGAVAEEMARRLHARDDVEVVVFTAHRGPPEGAAGLLRGELDGMPVISAGVPEFQDRIGEFDDPAVAARFAAALRAASPDVVHIHSVHGLGAALLDACAAQGVPYVVTLHDAWWLCPRQVMVRADWRDCGQTRIDLNLCRACVLGAPYLADRLALLAERLRGAAMVLSPTRFRRQLHLANGLPAGQVRLHPNGVRRPSRPRGPRSGGAAIRFGYWGGTRPVDGYALLHRACEGLEGPGWHLTFGGAAPGGRDEERDAFLDSIDVLLFPAQGREISGTIVREALARDVWVVATACGGAVEDVADGVNGTIIPMDGRPEALRAAIMALLDAPRRLAGYANPRKDQLATFDDQAAALFTLLSEVAATPERR